MGAVGRGMPPGRLPLTLNARVDAIEMMLEMLLRTSKVGWLGPNETGTGYAFRDKEEPGDRPVLVIPSVTGQHLFVEITRDDMEELLAVAKPE